MPHQADPQALKFGIEPEPHEQPADARDQAFIASEKRKRKQQATFDAPEIRKFAPPAPSVPEDLGIDPLSLVPATGEEWWRFLDRRFAIATTSLPQMGPAFALEVAASPVTDEEIAELAEGLSWTAMTGMPPPTRAQKDAATARAREAVEAENRALEAIEAKYPSIRQGVLAEMDKMLGGEVSDAAVAELIGVEQFEDLATQDLTVHNLAKFLTFQEAQQLLGREAVLEGGPLADEQILAAFSEGIEALQQPRRIPGISGIIPSLTAGAGKISDPSAQLQRVSDPELAGALEDPELAARVDEVVGEALDASDGPLRVGLNALGGLEGLYHAVSVPAATGIQGAQQVLQGEAPDLAANWKRSQAFGIGRSVAIEAGLEIGSRPFDVSSATIDFASRIFLDPTNIAGEFLAGAKLAAKAPGIAAAKGMRGRFAKLFAVKTPEEFVELGSVNQTLRRLWSDVEKMRASATHEGFENLAPLLKRYDLPPDALRVLARAESPDQLKRIFVDRMYGRLDEISISRSQAQLNRLDEADRILKDATPETFPVPKGQEFDDFIKQSKSAIATERRTIIRGLGKDEALTIIPGDPARSTWHRMKESLRRGDRGTPYNAIIRAATKENWADDVASILLNDPAAAIPRRGARETARAAGRKVRDVVRRPVGRIPQEALSLKPEDMLKSSRDMIDIGRVYGIPQNIIDKQTTTFINATSHEEAFNAFLDMLKHADRQLPRGFIQELTSVTGGSASIYGGDGVKALEGWSRVSSDGVPYAQPVWGYQVTGSVPIPNMNAVADARSYLGQMQSFLRGYGRSRLAQNVGGGRPGMLLADTIQGAQVAITFLTGAVWKPLVLLRLGWPLRVIPEEVARLVSVGALPIEESPLNFLMRMRRAGANIEVPEEALMRSSRIMGRRTPRPDSMVEQGSSEFYHALSENLKSLHTDELARNLARWGKDDALDWLMSGKGKAYREHMDLVVKRTLEVDAVGPDEWARYVEVADTALTGIIGNSDVLRAGVASGKLTGIAGARGARSLRVDDDISAALRQHFVEGSDDLPKLVPYHGAYERALGGANGNNGMVRTMMDFLGSKPTNYLNRAPAFKFFYKKEVARLTSYGVPKKAAEAQARQFGIQQVGSLLYDLSERTATDRMVRNFLPFFPAWKEVWTRWAVTIPATQGVGVGHAILARKVKIIHDALKGAGVIGETTDADGNTVEVFANDALKNFFGTWIGVEGMTGEAAVSSANILFGWPGIGPIPEIGTALLADADIPGIDGAAEAFKGLLESASVFGIDANSSPAGLRRAMKAFGLTIPLFDQLGPEQEATQDANFVINVFRTNRAGIEDLLARTEAASKVTDPKERAALARGFQREYQDMWDEAKSDAKWKMFRWGLLGMVSPIQPHLVWPGADEADDMRALMERVDAATGRELFTEWIDEDPLRELQFISKTYRLDGEQVKDETLRAYIESTAEGLRQSLGPDYVDYALGTMSFTAARARERRDIANLGDNWLDIMRNHGSEVAEIRDRARTSIANLEFLNPVWSAQWEKNRKLAMAGEGEDNPTAAEALARDAFFIMRDLEAFDWFSSDEQKDLGALRAALGRSFESMTSQRIPKDSFEATEIAYYDGVDDYYAERERIFNTFTGPGHTDKERKRGRDMLGELDRNYNPPVIDGKQMPHPQVMAYYKLDEAGKVAKRRSWAQGKIGWLTSEQRDIVGLEKNKKAETFWTQVFKTRDQATEYIRKQNWSESKKEATNIRDAIEAWEGDLASYYGVRKEYRLSQQPVYKRLDAFDVVKNPGVRKAWERVTQVANQARAALEAQGLEPSSIGGGGLGVYRQFVSYVEGYRRADKGLHTFLTNLQRNTFLSDADVDFPADSSRAFYPFLFFGRGD